MQGRQTPILRASATSHEQGACVAGMVTCALLIAMLTGLLGPAMYVTTIPSDDARSAALTGSIKTVETLFITRCAPDGLLDHLHLWTGRRTRALVVRAGVHHTRLLTTGEHCMGVLRTDTVSLVDRWTQFFEVKMLIHRDYPFRGTETHAVPLHVLWKGKKKGNDGFELIADETTTRRLECPPRTRKCQDVVILRTNVISYDRYFFQINLPDSADVSSLDFVHSVSFRYRQRNKTFTLLELGCRSFFSMMTIFVACAYWCQSARVGWARPAQEASVSSSIWCCIRSDQPLDSVFRVNWMNLMLVGVFLFNNPLYWLEFMTQRTALVLVATGFQLFFVLVLLTFWLAELGILSSDNPEDLKFSRFLAPKFVVMGLYAALAFALYGYVIIQETTEPLHDWHYDGRIILLLKVLGIVLALVYFVYIAIMIGSVVCGDRPGCHRRRRKRELGLLAMHLSTMVAVLVGLGIGAVYYVDTGDALDFLFFLTVINGYVYLLAYLYTPINMVVGFIEEEEDGPELLANAPSGRRRQQQRQRQEETERVAEETLDVVDIELAPLTPGG